MARSLCIVLLLGTWSWGDDEVPPGFLVHRDPAPPLLPPPGSNGLSLPLIIPLGQRLTFSWVPFAGSGPFHFDNLSSSPYYARDQEVEYGLRLGFDLALTEHVRVGLQLPYIYNPAPLATVAPVAPGPLSQLNDPGHLDLAFGLSWSF
jgi:hypothetical protein